jgi:O-antigen/teichoic acid export membrane protein
MSAPRTGAEQLRSPSRGFRQRCRSLLESEHRLIRLLVSEWENPVSRGGVMLLANTAVTGVLGLAYWILAARLYPQNSVGRAGALVSAATLLAGVGQLNLSGMLMRFLPRAKERSKSLVWITYGTAAATAVALTAIAALLVGLLVEQSELRLSPGVAVLFTLSVAATVVFTLQDSVLIAVRKTHWVPIENGAFGVAKILLLVGFASLAGWGAIFASWMLPLIAIVPVITWLLFRRVLPARVAGGELRPLRTATKRQIRQFVLGDATAGVFTQGWTYLLPVLVATTISASANALFYTAFLFSSTIDQIAANFSSALVVEGAHNQSSLAQLVRVTMRRIYAFLLPAVACIVILAPFVMRIYGPDYEAGAATLRLLALASIPKATLAVYYAICRVRHQTHRSAILQGLSCFGILGGALLVSGEGLTAIAAVVLGVQLFLAALVLPAFIGLTKGDEHLAAEGAAT